MILTCQVHFPCPQPYPSNHPKYYSGLKEHHLALPSHTGIDNQSHISKSGEHVAIFLITIITKTLTSTCCKAPEPSGGDVAGADLPLGIGAKPNFSL